VTRYWIAYLLSSEQTSTQAQLLFARALENQDLLESEGLPPAVEDGLPILVAWSDNGSEMTATDTRQFGADGDHPAPRSAGHPRRTSRASSAI
jgi:putative transposase